MVMIWGHAVLVRLH